MVFESSVIAVLDGFCSGGRDAPKLLTTMIGDTAAAGGAVELWINYVGLMNYRMVDLAMHITMV
jgi:hypothetical protein